MHLKELGSKLGKTAAAIGEAVSPMASTRPNPLGGMKKDKKPGKLADIWKKKPASMLEDC
jgi:hypothetical protein